MIYITIKSCRKCTRGVEFRIKEKGSWILLRVDEVFGIYALVGQMVSMVDKRSRSP